MKELHRMVELVASGGLSVILLGETGVGKDVLADTIRRASPRASAPYVRINCASLPETLLESELFGYERGAFSGATQAKPGLLEAAHGGTAFLDEIAELPLPMQAKLLRCLENREITRVGAVAPRKVDVRFIAATNRDLLELVRTGAFRQDLYFRLNGITLVIPPLRARRSEITPLARRFIGDACRAAGRPEIAISDEALALLGRYDWPGNVRELRNVVERAVTLCRSDVIHVQHLPGFDPCSDEVTQPGRDVRSSSAPPPVATPLRLTDATRRAAESVERQRIAEAMERCGGNQTRAAQMLGISRRTLISRLDDYGYARPIKNRGAKDS